MNKDIEILNKLANWLRLVDLLCLDCVKPLYVEMGLMLEHSGLLPPILREAVKKVDLEGKMTETIIQEIEQDIASQFSAYEAQKLMTWIEYAFFNDYSNPWYVWEFVFDGISGYESALLQSGKISESQLNRLTTFRYKLRGWDLDTEDRTAIKISNLRTKRLSDWDESFCARQVIKLTQISFRQNDSGESNDIFFYPIQLITRRRMQLGWKDLWSSFSIDEKSFLIDFFKRYLNKKISTPLTHSWSNPDSMTIP